MTKSYKDKAHEELLALHEVTSDNIVNLKNDNRTYLFYYSAITAALVTFHKDNLTFPSGIILLLLAIGAYVCRILIWDNRRHLENRREILIRVTKKFSRLFNECNLPDWQYENPKHRGWVDGFIYHVQLIYPVIVLVVTWAFLSHLPQLGYCKNLQLIIITILFIVWDVIFLNKTTIWIQEIRSKQKDKMKYLDGIGILASALPILILVYCLI